MFIRYNRLILLATLLILMSEMSANAQFGTVLYSDDFNASSPSWVPIGLSGSTGSVSVANGAMTITKNSGNAFGTYYNSSFSGHFEAEIEYNIDQGIGLALIKDVGGSPSLTNYSLLTVMTGVDGVPVIRLRDVQNGFTDVLDNTNKVGADKYLHRLTGTRYSLPFNKTAKKIKIFRHSHQEFLHFYYAVEKEIDGKIYDDWIELSPSYEWGDSNRKYFVGIFSLDGTTSFNKVTVRALPLTDKSDLTTGFAVTKRPYTWSGFTDSAIVVTFGDAFPFRAEDRKFVFWNQTNKIPVWHLNNGALMAHGFLETWDEPRVLGCNEPMSDRLLAFVDLNVIEDNAVRKVIKWTYNLVNPDYKYPAFGVTNQRAEATEYYYIYADGSIVRKAEYEHTQHPTFVNWYEHTELIVIAGENQVPSQLFGIPSLTIHDIGNPPINHMNTGVTYKSNGARLGAVALTAHVRNAPQLFYAFSDDTNTPETHAPSPVFDYEVTWHRRDLTFGHWPINKEPYLETNYCVNWSQWPQHISHASFIGVGVYGDQTWSNHFLRREDGTKYRQLLMLMGMNQSGSQTTVEDKTNSWLYPGTVVMQIDSTNFLGYRHEHKYFEFEVKRAIPACYFTVTPKTKLVNPILRIKGWGNRDVFVKIGGSTISSNNFITQIDNNGDLLILIIGTYTGNTLFEVSSALGITNTVDIFEKPTIKVFPNPVVQNTLTIVMPEVKKTDLVLSSVSGETLLTRSFNSNNYALSTSGIPSGVYLLRIKYGNEFYTQKVVIK
jgi:Secretion system C-terminal sorting domain